MWPSHGGWEGCDLISKTTSVLGVSRFGSTLSHGMVTAPTKAFFFHTTGEGVEVLGLGVENQIRRGLSYSKSSFQPRMEAEAVCFFLCQLELQLQRQLAPFAVVAWVAPPLALFAGTTLGSGWFAL